MTFDDRLEWLILGVVIGLFLGDSHRILREILIGVNEGNKILRNQSSRSRDERGVMSRRTFNNAALLIVVVLTAFAAFRSQAASNKADDNQEDIEQVVGCIVISQTDFLDAINTRTTYTQEQAIAIKKLQEAQRVFFGVLLHIPPYTKTVKEQAARDYQDALNRFLTAARASEKNAKVTKYPEADDLLTCIERRTK